IQDNEFELVFVVAYQKMLPLLYLDKLLDELQMRFRDMFAEDLKAESFFIDFSSFDAEYSKTIKLIECEARVEEEAKKKPRSYAESDKSSKSVASMIKTSKHELGPGNKKSQKKQQKEEMKMKEEEEEEEYEEEEEDEEGLTPEELEQELIRKNREKFISSGGKKAPKTPNPKSPKTPKAGKKSTTWDPVMFGGQVKDIKSLERTRDKPGSHVETVDQADMLAVGKSAVLQNLEVESEDEDESGSKGAGKGMFSIFKGLVGSKALTKEDLEPVISKLRDNLIDKNVASEVANKLCESVSIRLEGKLKFLENKFRVLIAACDTFRAGAVEQLRTHTRRLNSMHPPVDNNGREMVQLYEKGYGKDAAGIAMEAINYARDMKMDVVLVDTAGRMQDNEPLMRSLTKLISVNAPDLVLFVGEALVGNEAIDQLVKFNAALADHSHQENPHTIDGIVLTKFDTIDDKVGSAISMTYISGQPIVFVGTGQTYTDLKSLNAKAVVSALMK
ncbi:signal recognition particle receptor subunit alpha homolog, partial [Eurytemora carolleeae]|uniref:signal recognition particle receptor subunit alpha homolog n=1 Tax=Eurytemora carolleeae TaxID=1294199 RepID=UPI000C774283